ncbi:hypothetical protein AXF42_Ash008941 [Apostasia shenzhenica]|uniref:Uncharacterized protein n=1 Tax=Apostasia shenzhenica TaxID=1088818 RepID=A0A2I0ASX9_9ASPA|nr:hypothetical protein AXF42_Ash008941 [Apostasia shenzhenica]
MAGIFQNHTSLSALIKTVDVAPSEATSYHSLGDTVRCGYQILFLLPNTSVHESFCSFNCVMEMEFDESSLLSSDFAMEAAATLSDVLITESENLNFIQNNVPSQSKVDQCMLYSVKEWKIEVLKSTLDQKNELLGQQISANAKYSTELRTKDELIKRQSIEAVPSKGAL